MTAFVHIDNDEQNVAVLNQQHFSVRTFFVVASAVITARGYCICNTDTNKDGTAVTEKHKLGQKGLLV